MFNSRTQFRRAWTAAALAFGIGFVGGCSNESSDTPKIRSRKGVVKAIDLEGRVVAMTYTDKNGNDVNIEGTFDAETVIEINGRRADAKDVRVGDKIEVWGRREGEGQEAKLVATKVVVSRAGSSDWQATGAASQPAEKTAGGGSGD